MSSRQSNTFLITLIVGDMAALFIVTLVGFATHGELESAGWRLLTTFLPLSFSWLMVAPFFKVFDTDTASHARNLWRPLWAMAVTTPLAVLLRGLWLNRPIIPLFAVVLAGSGALAILVWRGLFLFFRMFRKR